MDVPDFTEYAPSLSVEVTLEPSAAISGLIRPSNAGPLLELDDAV